MASDLLFRKSKLSSKNWTRHQIASGRYNCLACSFMPEPNPQTWLALYLRCPIPKSCPYSCAPPGPHPPLRPFLIQEVNPLLIIKSSPFPPPAATFYPHSNPDLTRVTLHRASSIPQSSQITPSLTSAIITITSHHHHLLHTAIYNNHRSRFIIIIFGSPSSWAV